MVQVKVSSSVERFRMLITCKTYPFPTRRGIDAICVGGVSDQGKALRLYPVPFRYMDSDKRFKLYQWIEIECRKYLDDRRPESYFPIIESIRLGRSEPTYGNWTRRLRYVLPYLSRSIEDLIDRYEKDMTSAGIIKPAKINRVFHKRSQSSWSPRRVLRMQQGDLFTEKLAAIKKLPVGFYCDFRCDDERCKGHKLHIADWGLGMRFWRTRKSTTTDDEAAARIVSEIKHMLSDRDVYLIVGTMWPRKKFLIGGVLYPPRMSPQQLSLEL